jgi:hypothetical protein
MSNGKINVNDELERILNNLLSSILSYYTSCFVEGMSKTTRNLRITGLLTKIQTQELPETK